MSRKIEILCNDGSPLGVVPDTLWGDHIRIGLGGSETALFTMCETWVNVGYEVILYNNPMGQNNLFEQLPKTAFDTAGKHDILIAFRSPNPQAIAANAELKVWWSCDQHTVGDFRAFSLMVDKIVTISSYHSDYFKSAYGIEDAVTIDIPIRIKDYENCDTRKIPNRLLFSSVPDRGLNSVWRMWPNIKKQVPDAHIVITSDYRLWGGVAGNQNHIQKWMAFDDYEFLGAVTRPVLINEQLKADVLFYPSTYEELFCLAVAEAQVAGAYPLTSGSGAIRTTNMGTVLHLDANDPRNDKVFIDTLVELLSDREKLEAERKRVQQEAIERFDPKRILALWEGLIFE